MKKKSILNVLFILMLGSFISLSSCSTTRETEVGDELADFRSWVSQQTSQVANRTEEDWKQAKQDFRTRTQELDQKQEHFTDEVKQDYQNLKDEFNDADKEYQSTHLSNSKSAWERRLLGRWADMATINASNVREAYITFMQNVRAFKSEWSDEDWEMAKQVMQELNDRKSEISGDIDTDTEVKIKALQIEFATLETAADMG